MFMINTSLTFSCCASLSPQLPSQLHARSINAGSLENVKNLLFKTGIPSILTSPLESLQKGNWVKLICGASFEDVVDIRNLSLAYTLAGVDCIDCAADASVVNAVHDGIRAARTIIPIRKPWVMISVNDNEDLHFRKAEFDPVDCPSDCSRPCENVCPADAISFLGTAVSKGGGVLTERCYGCGRCLPVCPYDKIKAITYIRDVAATAKLIRQGCIDAIEIHTSGRQDGSFQELWNGLGESLSKLRLVAISLPNLGELTVPTMCSMYTTMKGNIPSHNLWQLDGRPMSGDIGRGTTREAINFARHLASITDKPQGFLQLAGGTNAHTGEGLRKEGLFQTTAIPEKSSDKWVSSDSSGHALISGVAFGGYARKIVGRILQSLESEQGYPHLENYPDYLLKALTESLALVGTVKCYSV